MISLKDQVNPHFLFNSLNALSCLVYDDQKKAVKFIRKLSDVYRYVLDQTDKELVTLDEEMQFMSAYFYLMKIRFEENLVINTEGIQDEKKQKLIPPMSIQLLVENAIKHNRFSPSDPLKLAISGKGNQIAIANELRPLPDSARAEPSGIGLTNLSDRFHLIGLRPPKVQASNDRFEVIIFLEPCT